MADKTLTIDCLSCESMIKLFRTYIEEKSFTLGRGDD